MLVTGYYFMIEEKISIILPCFNEEKNIAKNVKVVYKYLKENFSFFEIIISNDGSTDNTALEIEKIKKEIPLKIIRTPENKGKGDAVKNGVLASSPDSKVVMFLDADLAIPINELNKFFAELKNQKLDLVIASRFVPGLKVLKPVLWHRKVMEIIFRFLRAIILNDWQVRDSQCGFKVFKRSAAMKIFSLTTISRFAFDSEVIYLAKKFNFSIKELPITLCNSQESHIRMLFDPANMFLALFKIRWNDLRGIYNSKLYNFKNNVIISADDFGASTQANSNIINLIKKRIIDRVAIVVNGNISREEIKILKKSGVKIDLHLELFLYKEHALKRNVLKRIFNFCIKYLQGDFSRLKVKQLWTEQIQEFENIFDKKPDGLNSHEYIHLFPPFFNIACQLAKKYKIGYIRIGSNGQPFINKIIRHILQVLFFKNKRTLIKFPNLKSSDYLISLDWIIKNKKYYNFLKNKTEVVCHPEREEEYSFLEKLSS